jgi:hypothetical protein
VLCNSIYVHNTVHLYTVRGSSLVCKICTLFENSLLHVLSEYCTCQVLYELYKKYGRDEVLQGGYQVLPFTCIAVSELCSAVEISIQNCDNTLVLSVALCNFWSRMVAHVFHLFPKPYSSAL